LSVSRRYNNCLAGHVSHAATGERQYYEWKGPAPAVIGLRRHRASTWFIEEIKLRNNEEPPFVLVLEIREHFAVHGIGDRRWCQIDSFDRFLIDDIEEFERDLFFLQQAA
jgi:hypothetical protein